MKKKLFDVCKKILATPFIHNTLIRLFVWGDNMSYLVLTKLAVIQNRGVHPKHDIMQYHRFFIAHVDQNDVIADIGCGKGELSYDVAPSVKKIFAIDIKDDVIVRAKKKYARENIVHVHGDATTYDFPDNIDKIILSNVLEHIDDRVGFLQKLSGIADTLLLRVPMITRDWLVVYKKDQGLEYRLDPTHTIEFTLEEIQDETAKGGWHIVEYSVQFGEFWGVLKKRQ